MAKTKTFGSGDISSALDRLASAISTRHPATKKLLLLGIANGGVEVARRLATRLSALNRQRSIKAGTLDISFHRDDIGRQPIPKEFIPSHIPWDVSDATVILVDDVLFSGRTAKAALDELFDHGRPAQVELAVLIDRGGRKLPIAADYAGLVVEAEADEKVIVALDPQKPAHDSVRLETKAAKSKIVNYKS